MIDEQPVIMAVESSGSVCSVALSIGEETRALYESAGNNLHDKLLAEYVRRILNDLDLEFHEIDAIAVGSGPGSFTGLRIGASLAKGMTYGNIPKLIAVPNLTALAESARVHARILGFNKIISAIKSHKDFIYLQEFDLEINPVNEVEIIPLEELNTSIYPDVFLVGSLNVYPANIVTIQSLNKLTALNILITAHKFYKKLIFTDSENFIPHYFQDFSPTK